jgi:UTP--glucose-1-phosphate uridylyltransferase
MKPITKAIVAVAGSGTRLLPATKSMPKEMLPIVDKPIVQLVVEELAEAGIKDIILVTKWDKKPLEDHFDYNWALMNDLEKAGKAELKESMKKIANLANFIFTRQKPQYGNGVPILSAASLVKDEPFIFCFGDDLVKSKVSFTKQMIDEYNKNGKLLLAVQAVPDSEVHRYGIVETEKNSTRLKRVIEKPTLAEAPSRLSTFGRMILNQDIIEELKKTPPGKGGEIWIMDAIDRYVNKGGEMHIFTTKKPDEWLTTGDPLNYMKTMLKYAFDREDIGAEIKSFVKDLLKKSK